MIRFVFVVSGVVLLFLLTLLTKFDLLFGIFIFASFFASSYIIGYLHAEIPFISIFIKIGAYIAISSILIAIIFINGIDGQNKISELVTGKAFISYLNRTEIASGHVTVTNSSFETVYLIITKLPMAYSNVVISFSDKQGNEKRFTTKLTGSITSGATVTVNYDPNDLNNFSLSTSRLGEFIGSIWLFFLYFLSFVFLLIGIILQLKKRKAITSPNSGLPAPARSRLRPNPTTKLTNPEKCDIVVVGLRQAAGRCAPSQLIQQKIIRVKRSSRFH